MTICFIKKCNDQQGSKIYANKICKYTLIIAYFNVNVDFKNDIAKKTA